MLTQLTVNIMELLAYLVDFRSNRCRESFVRPRIKRVGKVIELTWRLDDSNLEISYDGEGIGKLF